MLHYDSQWTLNILIYKLRRMSNSKTHRICHTHTRFKHVWYNTTDKAREVRVMIIVRNQTLSGLVDIHYCSSLGLWEWLTIEPFDADCCHMFTAVPDWVKLSFVIFDIRALWRSRLSARMSKVTNDSLTQSGTARVRVRVRYPNPNPTL